MTENGDGITLKRETTKARALIMLMFYVDDDYDEGNRQLMLCGFRMTRKNYENLMPASSLVAENLEHLK